MTFFIRTANERDLEVIRDLLAATWHDTYDHLYGASEVDRITSEWHSIESLRQRLERPDSEFVVADNGQEIAGMAFAASSGEGRIVDLLQIYVLPRFQGQGAGSALLDELCVCFPQANYMRCEVDENNDRAIAFYKRHGFVRTGKAASAGDGGIGGQTLEYQKVL